MGKKLRNAYTSLRQGRATCKEDENKATSGSLMRFRGSPRGVWQGKGSHRRSVRSDREIPELGEEEKDEINPRPIGRPGSSQREKTQKEGREKRGKGTSNFGLGEEEETPKQR